MATSSLLIGVLGSLIGFCGGLVAVYLRHKLQNRTKRTKLRKALLAEIESTEWLTEDLLPELKDALENRSTSHTHFPTSVYDSNPDQIGLLSEPEAQALIRYYSLAHIGSEQVRAVDSDEGDVSTFVERTLDELIDRRDDAVEALRENL